MGRPEYGKGGQGRAEKRRVEQGRLVKTASSRPFTDVVCMNKTKGNTLFK